MPELAGVLLACLLGGGIVGWMIVDAVVERRERSRCEDLFVPLVGARIRLAGQHYTKRYEIAGRYGGRDVAIHCPVVSLVGRHLRVASLSTPVDAGTLDGPLASGDPVDRAGRTFRRYGGDLRLLVVPPLVFGPGADRGAFLDRVRAELDGLCEVAGGGTREE
jgi:hypothetical protein